MYLLVHRSRRPVINQLLNLAPTVIALDELQVVSMALLNPSVRVLVTIGAVIGVVVVIVIACVWRHLVQDKRHFLQGWMIGVHVT